ncbi:MAG: NifB/NifX family molybdenum-iron cluster-binding protein [bacterium]
MKIAISAQRSDPDAPVDPRFGRAPYFLIVDSQTMAWKALENTMSLELPQGAGIQAAQNLIRECPDVVLTGNCGPKAFKVLEARGIKVCVGVQGTAKEALQAFLEGRYKPAPGPNVTGHWA